VRFSEFVTLCSSLGFHGHLVRTHPTSGETIESRKKTAINRGTHPPWRHLRDLSELYDAANQKIVLFIVDAVRISNPIFIVLRSVSRYKNNF
jgi:hypothetical protein